MTARELYVEGLERLARRVAAAAREVDAALLGTGETEVLATGELVRTVTEAGNLARIALGEVYGGA